MKIETIARCLISPILIVCLASVGHAQQTDRDILSKADKNEIVASALRMAFGASGLNRKALSTENIEFVDASRMSEMGFDLVSPGQVRDGARNRFANPVVFQRLVTSEETVSVVFWQLNESYTACCWPRVHFSTNGVKFPEYPDHSCDGASGKHNYTFSFEFN